MTSVVFYFNVPDKQAYTCRLLRKAVASGAKVVVTGPVAQLNQLDKDLWTFSATDFLPHCAEAEDSFVRDKSPVVLMSTLLSPPFFEIAMNLGAAVPEGFEQFERLFEVVTLDEIDRKNARQRWKYYTDAGFSLIRHDLLKTIQ